MALADRSTAGPASGRRPVLRRIPWIDGLLVAWLAWGFDAINSLAPVRQGLAEHNGRRVLGLERSVHLAPEHATNVALAGHHTLSRIVVLWYENVHAGVTFAVIGWLWWRRADPGGRLRVALVVLNLASLPVFWMFPVAPPRMLVDLGYVDLVGSVHGGPVWEAGAVAAHSNQLTALPSLHIAWAAWASVAIWRLTGRRWLRALAVLYPLATTYAVMATANHYLADAVTGGALALIALGSVALAGRGGRGRPSGGKLSQAPAGGSPPA